jgi:DNA-directed RNA polymerase specialized sigma24 family protein
VRRNGRAIPRFPPDIGEIYLLPEDGESPDFAELVEEVCQSLNDLERRRWLLAIRDGRSISEIAEMEGVSRQAIIDCFHRMARKNAYVRIWLQNKNNKNQHG